MGAEVGLLKHLHTYKQKTPRNTKESRMKRNGETAEGVQMLQKGAKVNYVRVLEQNPPTHPRQRAHTPTHARTCTGRNTHARAQAGVRNMHERTSAQTCASTSAKHALTHERIFG